MTSYALDNDAAQAPRLFEILGAVLDGFTASRLEEAGIGPGRRCLEIGAGDGGVARWMADRVSPGGEVTATDIKPRHIPEREGVTVIAHDVRRDPLPASRFDVVHARLVLLHLPERRAVLRRLARSLAPGGALVIEEFTDEPGDPVLHAPDARAAAVFHRYLDAFHRVLRSAGADLTWGRSVHAEMRRAGLAGVTAVSRAEAWTGGTAGCLLHLNNSLHKHGELLAAGLTEADLAELRDVLRDPRLVISGYLTYSTCGFRPAPSP